MEVGVRSEAQGKAAVLVEALPYIRRYAGRTVVVKIGGAPLEDSVHMAQVAEDLALLSLVGLRVVIVHGGGNQVSRAMQEHGLEPRFSGGLRVTPPEAMDVVEQVLVGQINPALVRALGAAGVSALGLSGSDARFICASNAKGPSGVDLGRVGEVQSVAPEVINTLLNSGVVPVIASVAPDGEFGALNLNADSVAAAVAASLRAEKLVFLTNVEGLYADLADDGSLISELKVEDLRAMLPGLSDGMRPKARAAVAALDAEVGKVHILDGRVPRALLLEIFTDGGIGTQVIQ